MSHFLCVNCIIFILYSLELYYIILFLSEYTVSNLYSRHATTAKNVETDLFFFLKYLNKIEMRLLEIFPAKIHFS